MPQLTTEGIGNFLLRTVNGEKIVTPNCLPLINSSGSRKKRPDTIPVHIFGVVRWGSRDQLPPDVLSAVERIEEVNSAIKLMKRRS